MSAAQIKPALKERPPIVVVMGHVDHGKTTLLDTIRQMKAVKEEKVKAVAGQESGGITQHIGAYEITHNEKRITFIDTPGHEAFSAMRSHGTKVADIALLVVAADDGVKPQTKEALEHIKKAETPFVIVINKIDRPAARIEKVKNELAQEGILLEGRGGNVPVAEVSAKAGTGIDQLLELIILVSELEELRYDAVARPEGYVLESVKDPKRGVATSVVLVNGTLRTGDLFVCGAAYGKVKSLESFDGARIKGAVPSAPLVVVGLGDVSVAGDPCRAVETEAEAKEETAKHRQLYEKHRLKPETQTEGGKNVLSVILKADSQGTLEAITDSLGQIRSAEVGLKILRSGVGAVGEDDVKFSEATGAPVFTFRVEAAREAKNYIEQKGVEFKNHEVIYELIEDVKEAMRRLLEPTTEKREKGRLRVLAIFRTEPKRMIVGGKVVSGTILKGLKAGIYRQDELVGEGRVVGLRVGEAAQNEVNQGNEAGVLFEGAAKIKEGDELVAFEETNIYPEL